MGNPVKKLNKDVIEKASSYLREGNYIETVSAFLGISKQAFYDWVRRGARNLEVQEAGGKLPEDELIYIDFFQSIEEAKAFSEMNDLAVIKKASDTRWEAAAWRLERRSPERWGRRDALKADVNHSGGVKIIMSIPDREDSISSEDNE